MIEEILQKENPGLGNVKTEDCVGFWHYDATADIIFEQQNFNSYLPLAKRIYEKFSPSSILEFGCGAGVLSYHYRNLNPEIEYVTLDINKDVKGNRVINDETHFVVFTDRDLQIVKDGNNMEFDTILSFEHFEHIPIENITVFLKNIKKHCHENTIVVATAARWAGSDGRHPLILDYYGWSELLLENGFQMDEKNKFLTSSLIPYNFQLENSVELIFKLI